MNIGDEISYEDDFGRRKSGVLSAIGSDKDSYDDSEVGEWYFLL